MANDFRNPWVLDTTATPVKTGRSIVRGFLFRGYSTAGHKAVIQDGRGKIVAELIGDASLAPVSIGYTGPNGIDIDAMALTTLDSGQVVVDVA